MTEAALHQVGWGIFGLGSIAQHVASVFASVSNARLAAVGSRDLERARGFAARHGDPRAHDGYEALLADSEVDVIYLATPNALHAEQAVQAVAAGKHVLVEKPMALTVRDGKEMVAAAKAAGRVLGVGFHLRHQAVLQELQRRLAEGDLGGIVLAQAQWGMDGGNWSGWKLDPALAGAGSIMGLGVHLIDLLLWLTGQDVVAVSARADGPSERYPVEFLTLGTLDFSDGTLGELTCSRRLPYSRNHVTVYTPEARLTADRAISIHGEGMLMVSRSDGEQQVQVEPCNPYAAEIEAFSRSVRDGQQFAASGEDGLRVICVTEALIQAAASGQTVRLC